MNQYCHFSEITSVDFTATLNLNSSCSVTAQLALSPIQKTPVVSNLSTVGVNTQEKSQLSH